MKKILRSESGSTKVVTINNEPSLAIQSQKDQSDINKIMDKYYKTGMVTHLSRKQGQYADLTQIKDYQSSLQTVIDANASFMTLPSAVRKKFQNNPQELLQFLEDPNNKQEAIQLGLIQAPIPTEQKQNDSTITKQSVAEPKPKP